MLNPKLLNYLKELNLEPLWLHKNHVNDFNSLCQPKLETKKQISNSNNFSDHIRTQENIRPTAKQPIVDQQQKQKPGQQQKDLEVNVRSQFMLANKNNKTILVGFLNPTLNKKHQPLENDTYSKLLIELFKLLGLSYQESTVFQKNQLGETVDRTDIYATILFSQAFQSTKLLQKLHKKNIPILILEHPYYVLRNPLLKKEMWLKLKDFFNKNRLNV